MFFPAHIIMRTYYKDLKTVTALFLLQFNNKIQLYRALFSTSSALHNLMLLSIFSSFCQGSPQVIWQRFFYTRFTSCWNHVFYRYWGPAQAVTQLGSSVKGLAKGPIPDQAQCLKGSQVSCAPVLHPANSTLYINYFKKQKLQLKQRLKKKTKNTTFCKNKRRGLNST